MPVLSPSRYSTTSSNLSTGTYRSGLGSTSLDKPYYRSNSGTYVTTSIRSSIGDRMTEYKSRYSDVDGKRERKSSLVEYRTSRAPSVTDSDSGVSSRYRSERSESRSRDISTTRSESGKNDTRAKRPVLSTAAIAMSQAEFYNKYSPANYVPLTQRLQQNQNYGEIARSKSISNDIGRPPADRSLRKTRNSTAGSTIAERPERRSYKETSPNYKRTSLTNGVKDDNGNDVAPSVSEIRKRFDPKMTVTKLPANEQKYTKTVDQYLNQLKSCENGTGYTKILPKETSPVPVHLPSIEKNGGSRSNSSSDISLSKTLSEPASLAKNSPEKFDMSVSLTAKLPDRLASIKNQLDPNNPIGKILEKSTVIQVENGDVKRKESLKNDIEKQIKSSKHTSNFASYIPISQPVSSNKKEEEMKFIDAEIDNGEQSPPGTGFENKTFEHENFLKKRAELDEEVKPMETSTDSNISDGTDSSPETKTYDDVRAELAGGRSGPSSLRRSSERSDASNDSTSKSGYGSSQTSGLNGLRNIGNTCFMNSVVQCLSNTRPLLEYVVKDKHSTEINTSLSMMKGALIKAFATVIKELWRAGERDAVVNTTALKSQVQRFAPRFMGYSQQDAQEFLRYLLEGLHEDVNRVTVKPTPILTEIDDNLSDSAKAAEAWARLVRVEQSRVADIFVGQLKSTLRCTHCSHDSVTFDPFWDLSLPIPSRTGNLKLQQCLQHFTKQEELDGDEKPTCSKCGVRRKCLKWFTVQKFPQVLVLHLKRFSPTERFRGKLSVVVESPLTGLDMSPYAASPGQQITYNLYAVSNHSGTTYSGHYTAYCKHPYTGDWHEYNDSRVTPINPRNVVSSEAYVLFYELAKS